MNYSWDGLIQELAAAHKEVIEDIKSKFKGLQGDSSLIDDIKAFCAAVDWTVSSIASLQCVLLKCFGSLFLDAASIDSKHNPNAGAMDRSSVDQSSIRFPVCPLHQETYSLPGGYILFVNADGV